LKAKIDRLQVQTKYLEGVIGGKDGAKEGSCNEGGVATKPKRKRKRRTKKKMDKKNMETNREGSNASSRRDGVSNSASTGFAGSNNPSHVLFVDYYGHIRARFIGPQKDNVDWTIWVPKPLVTNMLGPIEKWVPKSKT
jgi:hypothetical protein